MNGESFRHWKSGDIYRVITVAMHSETREEMVVYTRVRDDAGQVWVRPLAQWHDEARPGVKRFVSLAEQPEPGPARCYQCGLPATVRAWFTDRHTGSKKMVRDACGACAGPDNVTDVALGTVVGS